MQEIALALLVFALLCASAGAGFFLRPRLPEHHRVRETTELMQITIGLLATFAALVLSLLTASVKQAYDNSAHDRQVYALQLGLLDQCLRDYGPETAAARERLHSYTAAVIASTWPTEAPPEGVEYPNTSPMPRLGATPVLAALMDSIGVEIARLKPEDGLQQKLEALCLERYHDVVNARLNVIEDARNELFEPFYQVLVFWLMIIFGCFGLVAPRHGLSVTTIVLCAVSLSSVIFVILDLSRPYEGFFGISSTSMRSALSVMLAPTR